MKDASTGVTWFNTNVFNYPLCESTLYFILLPQICMILYNFSFDDTNATVLAGHNLCLRSVDENCCVSFLVWTFSILFSSLQWEEQ